MNKLTVTFLSLSFLAIAFGTTSEAQFREQANGVKSPTTDSPRAERPGTQPRTIVPQPVAGEKQGRETTLFTDLGNGTVRENATGLIWLANPTKIPRAGSMDEAKRWVAKFSSGQHGLNDGSAAGDWRLPTANELKGVSRSRMAKHFRSEGKLRGYIGTAGGKFNSAQSVWGGGLPTPVKWAGEYSGSGEYIWPVSGGKPAPLAKTIAAKTYVAIESTVLDDDGSTMTSWELFEAAADFKVELASKEKQAVDNPMLKYCREQITDFWMPSEIQGPVVIGPRGTTRRGEGFRRTFGSIFLIDGMWVSEGRIKKYVFKGMTEINIAKPVTFDYRHGISWSPDFKW